MSEAVQASLAHLRPDGIPVDHKSAAGISRSSQAILLLTLYVFFLETLVIVLVYPPGVLSFLFFLGITLVLYMLFLRRISVEPLALYALFAALTLGLYLWQYWSYPEYKGFSGGPGIGTDDAFYFDAVQRLDAVPLLGTPADGYRYTWVSFSHFVQFVTPFRARHPFDVLFLSVMSATFVPVFTREVALLLTKGRKIARLAYWLTLFCPFLLAQNLILMREGLVAAAFMGAIFLFLKKRYIGVGLLIALLLYIRIASGLLLAFALAFFVLLRLIRLKKMSSKVFYGTLIFIVVSTAAVPLYPMVYSYLEGKQIIVTGSFVRTGYAESTTTEVADSIYGAIYQQPLLIRVPLGFAYFFLVPNFVPQEIVKRGIFRPRLLLETLSALLMMFFYFKGFIQAVFSVWKHKNTNLKITIMAYLVLILVTSQLSVQFRHKTAFLPLFYIIVAYGYYHRTKLGKQLGGIGTLLLAGGQFLRTLLRVF